VAKIKSQVRTASGISRFLDVIDPTGVYSQTDVVSDDGVLYREEDTESFDFQFTTRDDIRKVVVNQLDDVLKSSSLKQFYYKNYPTLNVSGTTWNKSTQTTNQVTGYFTDGSPIAIGSSASSNARYITEGSLVKFTAPAGQHFMINTGTFMTGASSGMPGSQDTVWAKIVSVTGDGSNSGEGNLADGTGPVTLNELVPSNAVLSEIVAEFATTLTTTVQNTILDQVALYNNFGLGYDTDAAEWYVIAEDDLNTGAFELDNAKDTTSANLDASWLIRFSTNGVSYTVYNRATRYIFESFSRNKFYFDESVKINDPETGLTIKDKIRVLRSNVGPDFTSSLTFDYDWQIVKNVLAEDGYADTRKMQVGFFDSDDDGVVDNPELFDIIVEPLTDTTNKYVFFQQVTENGITTYNPITNTSFVVAENESDITDISIYPDDQLFYFYATDTFKQYDSATDTNSTVTGYRARLGRQDLLYNYKHGAPRSRRIDPAVSNLIDVYMITKSYDTALRQWLNNNQATTKPQAPTLFDLENSYLSNLDQYKSVSDEVVINPGEYKLIFGPGADAELQCQFKVVKNSNTNVSDNQIKSDVIAAINTYFSLELWDFGDTFYFTELAAYIHNQLAPNLLSVVIVPAQNPNGFGSLFEINSEDNQILISSATVDNVEIITSITADKLKATGTVVTSSTVTASTTSTVASVSDTTTSSGSSGGYY
jgi:hypothetical protein